MIFPSFWLLWLVNKRWFPSSTVNIINDKIIQNLFLFIAAAKYKKLSVIIYGCMPSSWLRWIVTFFLFPAFPV